MILHRNMILIIVAFVMFMESLDSTIINTCIPVMAISLNTNPLDLKLALISYLLSLAIFIPISGWLADKYGPKRLFLYAVLLFTLSSIACGFSVRLPQLILFRMIQGMGSSLSVPIARLILLRSFERHQLIRNMSIIISIASFGNMLGPLFGGIIATHFSWPWIFWINGPVGFLTIYLAHRFLPQMKRHRVSKLDKLGFVLFGLGLSCLILGLSCLSEFHLPIRNAIISLGLALSLLLFYIIHSHRQPHPIIELKLFNIRTFKIALINNLLFRLVMGGIPFILPLLFQVNLGFSPQKSGLILSPIAIGVICMKMLDNRILKRFGHRKVLITNTFVTSIMLLSFSWITPSLPTMVIALLTFSYGFFLSLHYVSLNSLCYVDIPEYRLSSATSLVSTVQQVALTLGVAIAALLLRLYSGHFFNPKTTSISLLSFQKCFWSLAIFGLLFIFNLIKLKPSDGEELMNKS
jgi:EmrB/QacA subfamily drug resistance transporter